MQITKTIFWSQKVWYIQIDFTSCESQVAISSFKTQSRIFNNLYSHNYHHFKFLIFFNFSRVFLSSQTLYITCCYQIWTPPSWWSLPKPRSDASAAKINSSLDQPISSCCIVPADADFFNAKLKLFKYKQTFWTYLFIS